MWMRGESEDPPLNQDEIETNVESKDVRQNFFP